MIEFSFEYWYVFPAAVFVATVANASGFSGGVLFQPFFNFVLHLPLGQSIATGIATETVGMSSGAYRYQRMKQIDWKAVRKHFRRLLSVSSLVYSYSATLHACCFE